MAGTSVGGSSTQGIEGPWRPAFAYESSKQYTSCRSAARADPHARPVPDLTRIHAAVRTARDLSETHPLREKWPSVRRASLDGRESGGLTDGEEIAAHLAREKLDVSRAEHAERVALVGHARERLILKAVPLAPVEVDEREPLTEDKRVGDVVAPAAAPRQVVAAGACIGIRRM